MKVIRRLFNLVIACAALWVPGHAAAQTETLFTGIGMDTPLTFAHLSLPGATGIDFRFIGAFAPAYPDTVSHDVVDNGLQALRPDNKVSGCRASPAGPVRRTFA